MQLGDTFGAFDCPDGRQISPNRNVRSTPPQPLTLLNCNFLLQHATFFAEAVPHVAGAIRAAQVKRRPGTPTDTAPRKPHFAPKAKRVLTIFCSGAVSHLDTFDYKPELVKRSGQPLPGNEKLITFQGAQGNLVQPLWKFRPRGESGKMVS